MALPCVAVITGGKNPWVVLVTVRAAEALGAEFTESCPVCTPAYALVSDTINRITLFCLCMAGNAEVVPPKYNRLKLLMALFDRVMLPFRFEVIRDLLPPHVKEPPEAAIKLSPEVMLPVVVNCPTGETEKTETLLVRQSASREDAPDAVLVIFMKNAVGEAEVFHV